jgi:hypothetical protein
VLWIRILIHEGKNDPYKKKKVNKFNFLRAAVFFSSIFGQQNLGSRSGSGLLEMLDPDPYQDQDSMNPDPQH